MSIIKMFISDNLKMPIAFLYKIKIYFEGVNFPHTYLQAKKIKERKDCKAMQVISYVYHTKLGSCKLLNYVSLLERN